jgi:hypothetical protein
MRADTLVLVRAGAPSAAELAARNLSPAGSRCPPAWSNRPAGARDARTRHFLKTLLNVAMSAVVLMIFLAVMLPVILLNAWVK